MRPLPRPQEMAKYASKPHQSDMPVNTRYEQRILVPAVPASLGSHLCDRLIKDGHDVLCLDNFFTGSQAKHRPPASNPYFELCGMM